MPRKPREKYYQLNGRPHAGLDNPKRFGLTFNEVVKLIDTGKWKIFYSRWHRHESKRKRVEEEYKFVCPICFEIKTNLKQWREWGICCRECDPPEKSFCSSCHKPRKIAFSVGKLQLCKGCKTLLDSIKEV